MSVSLFRWQQMGKLALAAAITMVASTVANALPIVANNSFESIVSGAPTGNGGWSYTPAFGSLGTVNDWTFSPSTGSASTGTYAGIVSVGDTDGPNTGGMRTPTPFPGGTFAAFIEVLGWLSQSVSGFDAGQPYTVSFYAAGRMETGLGPQVLKVDLDSTPLTFSSSSTVTPTLGSWTLYTSDPFTTTAGSHTLTFTGVTQADLTSAIDLVNINAVPEPSSLGLLLLGMVGMNCFRTRRRSGRTAG